MVLVQGWCRSGAPTAPDTDADTPAPTDTDTDTDTNPTPTSESQAIPASYNAFVYLLSGTASFGGPSQPAQSAHHTLVLSRRVAASDGDQDQHQDQEEDHLVIRTGPSQSSPLSPDASPDVSPSPSAHFVLIAGEPLGERVAQYGPFVMSTQAEVEQALADYQRAENGFERARHWRSQIARGRASVEEE